MIHSCYKDHSFINKLQVIRIMYFENTEKFQNILFCRQKTFTKDVKYWMAPGDLRPYPETSTLTWPTPARTAPGAG